MLQPSSVVQYLEYFRKDELSTCTDNLAQRSYLAGQYLSALKSLQLSQLVELEHV